jgi:putative transposase
VAEHPRWGFWKYYDRMRLDGHPWNHKRVYRVYCALRLNVPRRTRHRHKSEEAPIQTNKFPYRALRAVISLRGA